MTYHLSSQHSAAGSANTKLMVVIKFLAKHHVIKLETLLLKKLDYIFSKVSSSTLAPHNKVDKKHKVGE